MLGFSPMSNGRRKHFYLPFCSHYQCRCFQYIIILLHHRILLSFSSHQLPSKHSKGIVLIWFIQYFTLTKPFKCFLNDLFVNLMPVSERCCSEAIGKLLCWGEFKQCHYLRSFNCVALEKILISLGLGCCGA